MQSYDGLMNGHGNLAPMLTRHAISPRGLPRDAGGFVGRGDELALIEDLLERHRLVTIVGMYGVGKTRLACRYAWLEHERSGVAVSFCDLAAVRSPDELVAALHAALHRSASGGAPALGPERVGSLLAERGPSLVVLDNFEHLVDAGAPVVARWLAHAPEVRFLVTSRERLRVGEEACVHVGPLPSEDAIQLLTMRAQRLTPEFRVDDDNVASVMAICEELDHLPLGLEMTAPWLQVLSASELAERLRAGLTLTHDGAAIVERHASLASAIAWSWDLLSPEERDFLAQVSRFRGRFTLDDASAVVGPASETPRVLTLIRRLRERSLLVTHRQPGARRVDFSVPAAVRAFATERHLGGEGAVGVEARYRGRIVELAASMLSDPDGPRAAQTAELERIRADLLALSGDTESDRAIVHRALAILGVDLARGARPACAVGPEPAVGPRVTPEPPTEPTRGVAVARLDVDARAAWFRVDGGPIVELGRRGPMRQILAGLVAAALECPGQVLDLEAVRELGWPGERLLPDSAANRVYAALSALRRLGLDPVLMTRRGGWLLVPTVAIQRVA